jgi:3-hydroxybutyryl-CoA dehydrogenase
MLGGYAGAHEGRCRAPHRVQRREVAGRRLRTQQGDDRRVASVVGGMRPTRLAHMLHGLTVRPPMLDHGRRSCRISPSPTPYPFRPEFAVTAVKTIAVIGAGTMGSGIALTAAQAGIAAIQIDVSTAALEKAKGYHAKTLGRAVEKQKMTQDDADKALAAIRYVADMADAKDADWVVEAASESVDLKKKLFKAMQATFRSDVVLATNTSSISITDIASAVGADAHRVIGMHFFNPVPIMKLVEVIKGLATSEETTARTIELATAMGKTPVPANDRAGFVSNRVLMPLINEAFHAWMEGVAKPEDIDRIMLLGCNFPMGPLRLADFIGLDVCHDIMMVLHRELGNPKFFPCPLLRQLVQSGRLGDKTGRGVYEYPAK